MNPPRTHRTQRGLGLLGLILVGALIAVIAVVAMKIFPTVLEYIAIKRAVNRAASTAGNVLEAQQAFDRAAAIEDITSITGKDLVITKNTQGGMSVAFRYDKRIPLVGPASLLLEYEGSSDKR